MARALRFYRPRRGALRSESQLLAFLLLFWSGFADDAAGQAFPTSPERSSGSDDLEIYLLVFGPGEDLLGRFGHAAIWVRDGERGTDFAYNYGISLPTTAPQDLVRQLFQNRIMVQPVRRNAEEMIDHYATLDRSVEALKLNLSPEQAWAMRDLLEGDQAGRPPQRQDFYMRNCTTGVRDVINRAFNGGIKHATAGVPSSRSLRFHSLRYVSSDAPLLYLGMLFGLGGAVDRPITEWEEMFIPELLASGLRGMTVTGARGSQVPVVTSEERLYVSSQASVPTRPAPVWYALLACGSALGIIMALAGAKSRHGIVPRVCFTVVAGLWFVFVGAIGTVLACFWLLTDQHLMFYNENLLQVPPLGLIAGWLVLTGSLAFEGGTRVVRVLAVVMAGLGVLGVLLKPLPGFHQANMSIVLFALPAHLGLAWGALRWEAVPSD